jgi:hypothetical protein
MMNYQHISSPRCIIDPSDDEDLFEIESVSQSLESLHADEPLPDASIARKTSTNQFKSPVCEVDYKLHLDNTIKHLTFGDSESTPIGPDKRACDVSAQRKASEARPTPYIIHQLPALSLEPITVKNCGKRLPEFRKYVARLGYSEKEAVELLLNHVDEELAALYKYLPSRFSNNMDKICEFFCGGEQQPIGRLPNEVLQMSQKPDETVASWLARISTAVQKYLGTSDIADLQKRFLFVNGLRYPYNRRVGNIASLSMYEIVQRCAKPREDEQFEVSKPSEVPATQQRRQTNQPSPPPPCYICKKRGHFALRCPQNPRNFGKSIPLLFNSQHLSATSINSHFICFDVYTPLGAFSAIVDTGSQVSLIRGDSLPNGARVLPSCLKVVGIDGTPTWVTSVWETEIIHGNERYPMHFYILNTLPFQMIIGLDSIRRLKLSIGYPPQSPALCEPEASPLHVNSAVRISNEGELPTQAINLLREFSHLFANSDNELGTFKDFVVRIDTGDGTAIKQRCRPIPFALRNKVYQQIQELLKAGIITHSTSDYAAPIVLQTKKDGSLRLCGDYKKLNAITVKTAYPLPRPSEAFKLMSGSNVFSVIDLRKGFHQLQLHPADCHKTAFTTPFGLFEYKKLPFGLTNGPGDFQRAMDRTFGNPPPPYMYVYMDDIIVFSQNETEHLVHLRRVFERLLSVGLKLTPKNVIFSARPLHLWVIV